DRRAEVELATAAHRGRFEDGCRGDLVRVLPGGRFHRRRQRPIAGGGIREQGAERRRFGIWTRGRRSAPGEPERVVARIPGHSPDTDRRGEKSERLADTVEGGRQPVVA